jgi:aryl-alcohol dehydrogenase-like predicted oxidoreductase
MLEESNNEGRVSSIGATYVHSAFPELMEVMRRRRVHCVQVSYNTVETAVTEEVRLLAEELDLGVTEWFPLSSGCLWRNAPRRGTSSLCTSSALRPECRRY